MKAFWFCSTIRIHVYEVSVDFLFVKKCRFRSWSKIVLITKFSFYLTLNVSVTHENGPNDHRGFARHCFSLGGSSKTFGSSRTVSPCGHTLQTRWKISLNWRKLIESRFSTLVFYFFTVFKCYVSGKTIYKWNWENINIFFCVQKFVFIWKLFFSPELLFPAGTDARRKCESGGFIRFVQHY